MIVCQKCNKQFEINFRDRQTTYPEKTLDELKTLICISDGEVNGNVIVKKMHSRSLKYWIGLTVTLIILILIGRFFGNKIIELININQTPK